MPLVDVPRVAVQDGVAAAVATALLDGRDPAAFVRLDRPGWGVALAAADAGTPLAVVLGERGDDDATAAALADPACTRVVVRGRAPGAAAAALLDATDATVHALPDGGTAVVLDVSGRGVARPGLLLALVARAADDGPGTGRAVVRSPALPWRVATHGPAADAWAGPLLVRGPAPGTRPDDDPTAHVDLVVVDAHAPDGALAAAAAAGAVSVAVPTPRAPAPAGATRTLGTPEDGPDAVRPVDATRVGPRGWTRRPTRGWGLVLWYGADPGAHAAAAAALGEDDVLTTVGLAGDVATDAHDLPAVCAVLADLTGVVDVPALHRDPAEHAHRLATWALAGVPVLVTELPREVRHLLGDRLADVLVAARRDELADPEGRERRAVLARRAAWLAHGHAARWRGLGPCLGLPVPPPTPVSLLLATNRPDFLLHGVGQALRQTWPSLELVVALHGTGFPDHAADEVRDRVDGAVPVQVLHVPDEASLGESLNLAAAAAGGDWVSKVDDDDWYGPDHVVDLLLAAEHSGADLLGKAAEFVHLAAADQTLRRFGQGQHTDSTTLAGGTLTLRRDVLRDVGGFAAISLGEDRALVHDVLAAGGRVHRTHGHGYLLHRHGRHAWEVESDYFRAQAVAVRPGRDHDWSLT